MSMLTPISIILYTMRMLKTEGSWCGETHVQKALFVCQEMMGVSSNLKFILYKHGPYSFDLSEHIQRLIADELIFVERMAPYGSKLCLSVEANSIAMSVVENKTISDRIDFIARKLGNKGVSELERLATAVYVNKKYGKSDLVDKRAAILNSLKSHVGIEVAKEAFNEVQSIEDECDKIFLH